MKFKVIVAAASAALVATLATPALADINITLEAPGAKMTTQTFTEWGFESFDSLTTGLQGFHSTFGGTSSFEGDYSNVYIQAPNAWGGADGTKYATADGKLIGASAQTYTLELNKSADYFGFYLMALSSGNQLQFYSGDTLLQTYDESEFNSLADSSYLGSPDQDKGQVAGEKFAFLNFNFTNGQTFDKVVFSNFGNDGFESDNHTVGLVAAVPEPGTWSLLLGGLGLIGFMAHRRLSADGRGGNLMAA